MKFKLTVLAAVLVASGAANAAIDDGNSGNGGLFFNAWDGTKSYTRDLMLSQDAFEAAVAAPGSFSKSWAGDALFSTFLSTANMATLEWNIFGIDTAGARRLTTTFNGANNGNKTNDLTRASTTAVQVWLNSAANAALGSANSFIATDNTAKAYAPNGGANSTGKPLLGYITTGGADNNSFATGIGFQRVDALATLVAKSKYTIYADGGTDMRVYLNGSTLTMSTVAAVPEPETYAMLLAGLGLIGSIARRRARRAA